MKKWTLLVAMIGVLLVTAFANDKDEIDNSREDQWKERRQFFKEQIKPKVDEQRNKLEASISAEDKKEISRIREEIISQSLMQNEFFHDARASRIKGEEIDEDLMQELKAQHIVIENLHDQAKLIANKYRPEIDDLISDLKGTLRSEREDLQTMRDAEGKGYGRGRGQYAPGPRGNAHEKGPRNHGQEPGMHRGAPNNFDGMGPGRNGFTDVVGFLLWDVNRG